VAILRRGVLVFYARVNLNGSKVFTLQANIFEFDQLRQNVLRGIQMHSNSADEKYKVIDAKIKQWSIRMQKPQWSNMNTNLHQATEMLHPFLPLIAIELSSIKNPFKKFNRSVRRVYAE
jgi:hypothetical protein